MVSVIQEAPRADIGGWSPLASLAPLRFILPPEFQFNGAGPARRLLLPGRLKIRI